MHGSEVRVYRRNGVAGLTKSLELRMLSVPGRAPTQHRLGEKPLAPERNEANRIEIPRVQRP